MLKKILYFAIVISLSTSCSFGDPLSGAQSLARSGKYEEAINLLEKELNEKPDSVPVKSILAQTYSDYGLALCQDPDKPPKIKYNRAREQFSMALALNPYLTDAKDMLEMIEKIQAHINESMIN